MTNGEVPATPDVYELVENVELVGIKFLEITGRAKPQPGPDGPPSVSIVVQEVHSNTDFQVRFRVQVDHSQALYEVETALSYVTKKPFEHDSLVLAEFIERVAIMSAFPYMREAVSTTAAKLELDVPILGILRQGEFQLGAPSGEAAEGS